MPFSLNRVPKIFLAYRVNSQFSMIVLQLTELSLTTNSYHEKWVKSDKSPSCWLGLPNLQKLTLSGHSHFDRIPEDFARLPLTYLDLSFTRVTDFSSLRSLQSLQVLSMQVTYHNVSFPARASWWTYSQVHQLL